MLIRRKLVSGSISYQPNATDSIYDDENDFYHMTKMMVASHTSLMLLTAFTIFSIMKISCNIKIMKLPCHIKILISIDGGNSHKGMAFVSGNLNL